MGKLNKTLVSLTGESIVNYFQRNLQHSSQAMESNEQLPVKVRLVSE
jgi:hypothetical protein